MLDCKHEDVCCQAAHATTDKLLFSTVTMLAADDSEYPEVVSQLQLMAQVAQLLAVLIKPSAGQSPEHHHLSKLHPRVGHILDRHSQDADTRGLENSSARSWRSWSSVCEGPVSPSTMTEAWPTPTAEAWQDKSAVALLALRWLNNPESTAFLSSEAQSSQDTTAHYHYQAAGESISQLLHCCLAGELTAH